MMIDRRDEQELIGQNGALAANGNNGGQAAVGETVIQFGPVVDSQITVGPAAPRPTGQPIAKNGTLSPAAEREELILLRRTLSELFDQEELRDLAFDLAVDYDSLPGPAKRGKARELVAFFRRHGRLAELKRAVAQRRPGI
jgi:hypothetical protein